MNIEMLEDKVLVFSIKEKKCKNPYGNGKASKRIVKVLSEIKIDKKLLQKRITY
ncbi:MAG: UDP-N-acetyl glucosamine 2-epimerase [Candidatus Thermoplasmatota archaeon]|nr:UDP-N-acetyl glucosamine 2-epimerase [Candidatus Thermoplasmatota archaeon]MBU4256268.1 UDP-N-acetyl glucosamine 2-epimerase [Candidatus Thermoplasmatota archaeon]